MKNIVVFGFNRLSLEAMTRMDSESHNIVIAEHDAERVARATENGFTAVVVDFRNDDELKAIGLGKSIDTLFCFLPEDSENVFLTLSARSMDQNLTIIAIVEDPDAAEKLIAAGANKVIDPYEICGRKIHEILKKPDIAQIIDQTVFGRHDLHVAEIEIGENSVLENTYSSQLRLNEEHNLVLIGIVDKELGEDLHFAISEHDHRLNAGDILVILGPSRDIRAFKKKVAHVREI